MKLIPISLKDANRFVNGEHDEKVKIKLGENTRTVDLSDTLTIKPYFDIDTEIMKDPKTGHPTFESIDKVAKKRNEILNDINVGVRHFCTEVNMRLNKADYPDLQMHKPELGFPNKTTDPNSLVNFKL